MKHIHYRWTWGLINLISFFCFFSAADNVTFNNACSSHINVADIEQGTDLLNPAEDPSLSAMATKDESDQDIRNNKVSIFVHRTSV